MDRSRILVAIALSLALLSTILGIVIIGNARQSSEFVSPSSAWLSSGKAGIAHIKVEGPIFLGKENGDFRTGVRRTIHQLKQVQESPAIRAVLLEISSSGGTVGATKLLYDEIKKTRRSRPIVAFIPEIAASGGYYVASAANRIFAYESAIIGSIGVISFHPDLSGLLNQHGIRVQVIKSGRLKDSSYPFRLMNDEELAMRKSISDDAYAMFLTDVADSRGQGLAVVEGWADGKIYSGKQARLAQLITDTGNRDAALVAIKELLNTADDLPLQELKSSIFENFLPLNYFQNSRSDVAPFLESSLFFMQPGALQGLLSEAVLAP